MLGILGRKHIRFKDPAPRETCEIHTDASLDFIAAVSPNATVARTAPTRSILQNELAAVLLGINLFRHQCQHQEMNLALKVDNMAVVALIATGACKWQVDLSLLFALLAYLQQLRDTTRISVHYIHTTRNRADHPSRTPGRHLDSFHPDAMTPDLSEFLNMWPKPQLT